MTTLLTAPVFLMVTFIAVAMVAKGRERTFLWYTVLLAWIILLPLVTFMNDWMPFAGGGDDESYYELAGAQIHSYENIFDLSRFVGVMEQGGFPWLLSIVNYFSGQDLLTFKSFNLMILILLAIVWYRIATLLESDRFGRIVAVNILMLTPLWYYVFFLYKDLVITLLQSLFLLGLVQQDRHRSIQSWLLIVAPSIALIPFRSALVVLNAAVLLAVMTVRSLRREQRHRKILPLIMGGTIVAGLLAIASNPQLVEGMGIYTEARIVGTQEMLESAHHRYETSRLQRALFPVLYLFSETAGLSPQVWERLDARWLRGFLALPWIFVVVPLFLLGILRLARAGHDVARRKGWMSRWRRTRMIQSSWLVLVVFVAAYATVSWVVGDTTRWRVPDMPVVATIAVSGWHFTSRRFRQQTLVYWITGSGALFSMVYLLRSM